MSKKSLAKNIGSMSFAVLLSRILGLIRDQFTAYFLGTSIVADAFNAAYYIPNLLRRLFGEGALSAAFVPIYQEIGVKKGKKEQIKFAINTLTLLCFFLTILSFLGIIFTPLIVKLVVPGFSPEAYELTIKYTRILFPYLFMIGFSSTLISILNAHNYYFIPGLSSAFLNLAVIASLSLSAFFAKNSIDNAMFLAVGTLIGGVLQTIVNFPLLRKVGYKFKIIFNWKGEALKELWTKFIPGVWGIAVRQVNLLADKIIASYLITGSITALQYGNRLMQLPLGIFGVAIGTATIPHFSKCVAEENWDELSQKYLFSILTLIMVLTPITILIFIFGQDYIRVLFMRGEFDEESLIKTFNALCYYSLGLIFYGLNRSIISLFYAHKDTKTPVIVSFFIVAVNILLNLILMKPLGYRGLALATSISSTIQFIILSILVKKRFPLVKTNGFLKNILKILFASILMFIGLFFTMKLYVGGTFVTALIRSFVGSGFGFGLFFILCFIMKIDGSEIVRKKLLKR